MIASLRTPLAVLAATAAVTGVALTVSDQARSVVDMAPVGVWFANDDADSVSHVGPAGTDATVQIAQPDGTLRITELDGVAYVTDDEGHLSRIDPAQLVVSQETTLPSSDTQLIGGGGRLYVVDHATGTVRELDPIGLTTIGETTRIGDQLGAAVVDDQGVLWVPDLATGQIVAIDGRNVTGNHQVARPGEDVRLSVVDGVVVALNPTAATVTEVAGGGNSGDTHPVDVAPGASAPAVVGGTSVLPVVTGSNLVTLDLRNGRTIRIELTEPDHRLGTPVIAGDRVYVPDFTAGTLIVVDLATKKVVSTLRVTGRSGTFELVVDDGRVFVNDPSSERAWSVSSSGALVPVAKYDPSQPGTGTGTGVVPPVPPPRDEDERDDDKSDEQDDPPNQTTTTTSTVAPQSQPPRDPSRQPSNGNGSTTTTAAPVVIVPPSAPRPAEPPVISVPRPTEGGNGDDDGKGRGDGSGSGPGDRSGDGPTTTSTTTSTSLAPSAPDGAVRDVVAVAGDGQVSLSWSAPQGWKTVTGYTVTGSPGVSPIQVPAGDTQLTVSRLTNGTEYVFSIVARSDDGNGAVARSAPVTPSAAAPDAPSNVAVVPGDGAATVTWDAPRTGKWDAFEVQIVQPSGASLGVNPASADQRQINITGLANGTTYYATVRARNGARTGAAVPSSTFVPVGRPGRPGGVTAAVTAGSEVTVSWTEAPPNGSAVTGYQVTAPGLSPVSVNGDRRSAVFRGLQIGDTHTFTVVATNGVGDGPSAVSSPVVVQSQVPGAPGSVTVTAGDGSATITWSAAPSNGSTISAYRVHNLSTGTFDTVPAAQLDQTVTGLSNGTSYSFAVQAVATNGSAGPSAPGSAVTPFGPLPAPTNVVAVPGSATSISVTFDAPAVSNGNAIDHWVVSTEPATTPMNVTSGSATFVGLTPNVSYTVSVVAVATSAATSPAGTATAVTTPLEMPAQVTGLRVTRASLGNVTIVWDAMPFAAFYRVDPGDGVTPVRDVTTNSATWDPPNEYDVGYQASVTAYSSYGAAALAATTWYFMPPDPIDTCGTPRKLCP